MDASPVIAILGPTASGKSALALALAGAFSGEVVNCDSLQVYRYFDIGTDKLPPEQRRGIPHHLIDILDPDQLFTAGDYARVARRTLGEIGAKGRLPVVVGGTGFYLRALVDGLFRGPQRDQVLRDRLVLRERRRPGSIHRLLARFDPGAAARIHPNDLPKMTRALEVRLLMGRPATKMFLEGRDALQGYRVLKIGLSPSRDALYERLNRRAERMFEGGLIDETRNILGRGFPASCKPFESHGYRQAIQVIDGELSLDEAIFYTQRSTRRYAKRQMTWFRQEPGVEWLNGFGDDPRIAEAAAESVRWFLPDSSR